MENETKAKKTSGFAAHKKANIAVIIVAGIAALILIAIAVLSLVKVNPTEKLERPNYYALYNLSSEEALATNSEAQSKIAVAMDDMQFTVMSGILQGYWDYTFAFKRNGSGDKLEMSASEIKAVSASETEYMVELVYSPVQIVNGAIDYSTAHSLEVDGETVYFDRIKVLIGDTAGQVGSISLYPYLSVRIDNESDVEGITSDTYKATGINVRANTANAYASLKELVRSFSVA